MKCEKCNEREVNFHYSFIINNEKAERHLCSECAREEGFSSTIDYRPLTRSNSLWNSFYTDTTRFMTPFGFFGGPMSGIMPAILTIPSVGVNVQPECCPEESEASIPADAGEEIKARRELYALKSQLEQAVKDENYEKAIELRDRIKALEK